MLVTRFLVLLLLVGCESPVKRIEPPTRPTGEFFLDTTCSCRHTVEPGELGHCMTQTELDKRKQPRTEAEDDCGDTAGCRQPVLFRVCDDAVGPMALVEDFVTSEVVLPGAIAGTWKPGDRLRVRGNPDLWITRVIASRPDQHRGHAVDRVFVSSVPTTRVLAGTAVLYQRGQ